MDSLSLTTAGSVDDGKSTLIGRLLMDSGSLPEDQLHAASANGGSALAWFTDGLKAEREQGITIDVAYRYFRTSARRFVIADAPGHFEYTRNMVTAASTCQLALLLVDARAGMTEQTCRHAFLASLLGLKSLVLCINKMDLVDWSEAVYDRIREDFLSFVARLDFAEIHTFPISALLGDNVAEGSTSMPWYRRAHAPVPPRDDPRRCDDEPDRRSVSGTGGPTGRRRAMGRRSVLHGAGRERSVSPGRRGGRSAFRLLHTHSTHPHDGCRPGPSDRL